MAKKLFNNGQVFTLDKSNISVPSLITEGECNVYVCKFKDSKPYGRRYFLFTLSEGDIFFPFEFHEGDTRIIAVTVSDMCTGDAENFSVSKYSGQSAEYAAKLLKSLDRQKADVDSFIQQLTDNSLSTLNDSFPKYAAEIIFRTENNEKVQSRRRFEKERDTYYQSFGILAKTMKSEKQLKTDSSGSVNDNLFKACKIITSFLKINISVPDYLKKGSEVRNPLDEIAFASRFRTRKILLEHNWHKSPSTPILAYLKTSGNPADDLPVALIPRLTHYDIYNPAENSTRRLNKKTIQNIRNEAYVIYRNLPAEKLSFSDILKFAANGIKTSDIICLIGFGLAGGILGAISPLIISWIFDSVIPDSNQSMLLQLFVILLNITVVNFVFEIIRSFSLMRIENSIELDLQSSVWDRLLGLPAAFFKKFSAGELAQKLDGISDIAQIISSNTINQVLSSVFGIFYVIVMFSINPHLALISSGLILVSCIISLFIGMREIKYYQSSINLSNTLSGRMYSWIQGISKIRLAGAESRIFNIWSEKFSEIRREDMQRSKLNNASVIFTSSVSILISICLYKFMTGSNANIASGTFIAFNTALQTVLLNTLSASSTLTELNTIIPLYKNIKPILETVPEYNENYSDIGEITGDIEISHISFRYDKDLPLVLDDVSIHIKSGEHIALVGPSGSGKSTLLRILLGFERAETGQIYFDGKDISQVDIRTLRKQLGVVLQSGKLLPGSIFENIVGANCSVTMEEVNEAVEKSGLSEDIKDMPMGLHTVVAEDSNTLSGGQRQRLLIARALISKPKILFFDEATSALDNKTQETVKKNVDALKITRITIAHRLSTITGCDRIIVLKDGRIAEEGTYQQLMDKNGIFTEMAKRQIM